MSPQTLDHLADQSQLLIRTVSHLTDLTAPSLCEGWTRAHVLAHLARNADGLRALVRAGVDGSGETMYRSPQDRDADIEMGAAREPQVIIDDVLATIPEINRELARLGPGQDAVEVERTPGGPRLTCNKLPMMRLREVVFHHVDLDAGFTFADLDSDLLLTFLEQQVRRLRADPAAPSLKVRTDEGDVYAIGDGTAYVTGSRAGVLLWLARQIPDGVHGDRVPPIPAL